VPKNTPGGHLLIYNDLGLRSLICSVGTFDDLYNIIPSAVQFYGIIEQLLAVPIRRCLA
jgi:hypothetical protein